MYFIHIILPFLSIISIQDISVLSINTVTSNVIHLSPNNCGDVYLVSEFVIVLHAYHTKVTPNATLDENVPLDLLAKGLFVQEHNDYVNFWNIKTAKLLMQLRVDKVQKYSKDIELALNMNHLKLDNIFNELVGINYVFFSSLCKEMFGYFGNFLAETLGIGCPPTGLLNLNALIIYDLELPKGISTISPNGPLKELGTQHQPLQLIQNIGKQSILIDAAAYWNQQYIFQDSVYPIRTASGYISGNLIGDKQSLTKLNDAAKDLVSKLTPDQTLTLCVDLLEAVAVDSIIGKGIVPVFIDKTPTDVVATAVAITTKPATTVKPVSIISQPSATQTGKFTN